MLERQNANALSEMLLAKAGVELSAMVQSNKYSTRKEHAHARNYSKCALPGSFPLAFEEGAEISTGLPKTAPSRAPDQDNDDVPRSDPACLGSSASTARRLFARGEGMVSGNRLALTI